MIKYKCCGKKPNELSEEVQMYDNDWALIASILGNLTAKQALAIYGIKFTLEPRKDLLLTRPQALNIKFLLKTMTWNKIAEKFDISEDSLRQQVYSALKKATKNPDQSVQSSKPKNPISLYHTEGGKQIAN